MPKQPAPDQRRALRGGSNIFLVIAAFIFGLALIASGGPYAYDRYLSHALQVKAEELAAAQRDVNQDQVEDFIRLRDRLTHGRDLLSSHIALSQVFDVFETQTLATVRFSSLELTVADDATARLEIAGTARNFNALAAQSNAFAAEKGIRRAIFSGIVVNQNNTVNFRLTADLDSRLLISRGTEAPAIDALTVPVAPAPAQAVPLPDAATTSTSTLPSVPALTP